MLPVYTVQVAVSAVGLGITAAMLAAGRDPAVYLPVLTSIVAYWLPAPRRAPPEAAASSVRSVRALEDDGASSRKKCGSEACSADPSAEDSATPGPAVAPSR